MSQEPAVRELESLLAARRFEDVLRRGQEIVERHPKLGSAWFAMARAALGLGRLRDADRAIASAMRLVGTDHRSELLRAIVDHRLGRTEAALDRARRLVGSGAPNAADAAVVIAEALYHAGRREDLKQLVADRRTWSGDARAEIYSLRAHAPDDPAAAAARFEALARGEGDAHVRRVAGFDAVRLLDAAGQFHQAFDLAAHVHATTGSSFDVGGLASDVAQQLQLLSRGTPWFRPRAAKVSGIAVVVGMPRSGTTLLEQMLDRHPAISGIGEYEGLQQLGTQLVSAGAWPRDLDALDGAAALAMQREYVDGARSVARPGAQWTFDKALHAWRLLPAVAAVLPGASCIRMMRDPRDTAISMFLSNFHPGSFGWTRSLEDIRAVTEMERALVPQALSALGIGHESVVYEDLVADPHAVAARCLASLGLPMDASVLAPEANARTVLTLSHQQVRAPINASSIGRWRNYEWAFGEAWAAMARAHDACRRS